MRVARQQNMVRHLNFMYIMYQPIVVLLPKVYQVRVTRTIYESELFRAGA